MSYRIDADGKRVAVSGGAHPMAQPWLAWVPIEDARKPQDLATVLLHFSDGEVSTGWFYQGKLEGVHNEDIDDPDAPVTHWARIPLPEDE